jgi:hypothetical protein
MQMRVSDFAEMQNSAIKVIRLIYGTKLENCGQPFRSRLAVFFLVVWLATDVGSRLGAEEFVDNYDLNGDYARYVYRVEGMRIWNQSENGYGVREWGPVETDRLGTLVLRYRFDGPIESASVQAAVQLWREKDEISVAVSNDDQHYTVLATDSMVVDPEIPDRMHVLDLTPYVADKRNVYIRFQAKGTRLNTHIMTPSVLRTVGIFPANSAPYVFEFRAKLRRASEEELSD